MVNQIFYFNSDKFPAIAQDYSSTKAHAEKTANQQKNDDDNVFKYALESIPTFRRTASVPDKLDNGDYLTTAGVLGYTLVNIKEDIRDTLSAGKQIYAKINPNFHYDPRYDRYNYQHEFSATRGMIGEKALYESADKGNPFTNMIKKAGNTTIDNTKFGQWILKKFGIVIEDVKRIDAIQNYDGKCARAYKFNSSVLGGKTIARAMKRTTLLGVAIMGALEIPKIVTETMKGDSLIEHVENGVTQTIKSAGNVALTTAGIALGGAIGAKHLGATGSIVGMGIGAIAGSKLYNQLQKAIS